MLGYGGAGFIAGTQVLITGGSLDFATTVSYLNMYDTPPSLTMAGRVMHSDGTNAYSGSINFDVTMGSMGIFTRNAMLKRYYEFDVEINDGNSAYKMEKCKVTSLTLAGTAGGLVTAQVGFLSKKTIISGTSTAAFIRDSSTLLGYWYTGTGLSDNLKDWNLTMSQEARLAYCNEAGMEPAYIKVGGVSYTLSVTSYDELSGPSAITIGTQSFTLTGNTVGHGFSFGGVTDVGSYNYTFETSSDTGISNSLVIS